MLRKLEKPSCVQVAENHKNLVREGRKFGGGGGVSLTFMEGRQYALTVLLFLSEISGFIVPGLLSDNYVSTVDVI
jgi:hypothetical protein